MARLEAKDYMGSTVDIARALVGCYLVRRVNGELLVCRITETEAYVGAIDKACHAYGYRKTKRNATMFGPAGRAYLYLIYGMYTCLNFVTNGEGEPDAVLLRGLEVVHGRETMSRLRYGKPWEELTAYQRKNFLNGPGKCCKAVVSLHRFGGYRSPSSALRAFHRYRRKTHRYRLCRGGGGLPVALHFDPIERRKPC